MRRRILLGSRVGEGVALGKFRYVGSIVGGTGVEDGVWEGIGCSVAVVWSNGTGLAGISVPALAGNKEFGEGETTGLGSAFPSFCPREQPSKATKVRTGISFRNRFIFTF
jgi:hypothetical protein